MKKVLTLLLASAIAVMSISACTGPQQQPAQQTTALDEGQNVQAPPPSAGGDTIKVDVFWYTFNDTFATSIRNAMEQQLNDLPNISYTMHDSEDNQATQTEKIRTALIQGTDLLVVQIVTTGSEEAAQNIVEMARENDVPLIFFNREVSDAVVNSYDKCAFVGTDADEAGIMQGQAVA